jgi:predicted metal-dependent phosphoesterase TrpH
MLIDMHNHTNISSPCSVLTPEELIARAKGIGLDAICVTEHDLIEGANVAREIGLRMGFPVFRGIEARSEFGDRLVFGYYRDIPEGIPLDELCRYVHEVGGAIFVAHPYHVSGGWNLYLSMKARGLDLDRDWSKVEVLKELNGVEILNGQVAEEVNEKARQLARWLKVNGIGGSDAHGSEMIGKAATRFKRRIRTEEELVDALRKGDYQAVKFASLAENARMGSTFHYSPRSRVPD